MALIKLQIGKSVYKVECPEEEIDKLTRLATKIDERVKKLSQNFQTDEKTILLFSALMMEDEIETIKSETEKFSDIEKVKNSYLEERDQDEIALYTAMAENLENISDFIEKLAIKIEER